LAPYTLILSAYCLPLQSHHCSSATVARTPQDLRHSASSLETYVFNSTYTTEHINGALIWCSVYTTEHFNGVWCTMYTQLNTWTGYDAQCVHNWTHEQGMMHNKNSLLCSNLICTLVSGSWVMADNLYIWCQRNASTKLYGKLL
jgi:hypothetical protein